MGNLEVTANRRPFEDNSSLVGHFADRAGVLFVRVMHDCHT